MNRPRSLRLLLLRWLAPAMLILLAAGAATAYSVALRSATLAYDRSLLDTALALAGQIRAEGGRLALNLPRAAQEVLLTDTYDRVFFRVLDAGGAHIAGNPELPRPTTASDEDGWLYYDAELGGKPVRVAAYFATRDGGAVTVLAAETLVKRNALVREILLGMLLPELGLIAATLLLVWFGIRSGLRPLDELQRQLAHRSHADLRPIAASGLPDEIQPVVDEINDLLQRLDHSLQAQQHFVSDAAHQLRTPIAALQAQVEMALREAGTSQRPQLEQILAAAQRLVHLVHQLLALARAEPNDAAALHRLDVADAVREAAEVWLPQAIAKGVDLGFELAPAAADGAPLLLQELIGNLIDNAIRYTPANGTVTVRCSVAAGSAMLEVEDSGPGIPLDERERVFERFHRLPASGDEGCGLGLAIVRQIARQHGANVVIGKSVGLGGASIRVSFPPLR